MMHDMPEGGRGRSLVPSASDPDDQQAQAEKVPEFEQFVAIDWSGAKGPRQKGIAVAVCKPGRAAPYILAPEGGWSRAKVLAWMLQHAEAKTRMLVGLDLSPAFPFGDQGYFPGLEGGPRTVRDLWAYVDDVCFDEPHLGANSFLERAEHSRHFRIQRGAETIRGEAFEGSMGRLRVVEARWRDAGFGQPSSCFNLVGAAQVGKSSLTGMRVLNRLQGAIPMWPFDPVPEQGPLLVEIYTTVAARAAKLRVGRSKIKDPEALAEALDALDSKPAAPMARYVDHATDALVSAAWLRRAASDADNWNPSEMKPEIARTEGWTFGIA